MGRYVAGKRLAALDHRRGVCRRKRLRAAGLPYSPEVQELLRRVAERDEHLWAHFGVHLLARYRGKWAAISNEGEVILGDSDLEVSERAARRFGPYNSYAVRLDESRGAPRIGPRAG